MILTHHLPGVPVDNQDQERVVDKVVETVFVLGIPRSHVEVASKTVVREIARIDDRGCEQQRLKQRDQGQTATCIRIIVIVIITIIILIIIIIIVIVIVNTIVIIVINVSTIYITIIIIVIVIIIIIENTYTSLNVFICHPRPLVVIITILVTDGRKISCRHGVLRSRRGVLVAIVRSFDAGDEGVWEVERFEHARQAWLQQL